MNKLKHITTLNLIIFREYDTISILLVNAIMCLDLLRKPNALLLEFIHY